MGAVDVGSVRSRSPRKSLGPVYLGSQSASSCSRRGALGLPAAYRAFNEHPDHQIITSFVGLADLTGARLLAEIGDDRRRFADARALKAFAGSAPVTKASGRSIRITHRHVKNNRLQRSDSSGPSSRQAARGPHESTIWAAAITATAILQPCATSTTACSASSTTACKPAKPTIQSRPTDRHQRLPNTPPLDS